VTRFTNAAIPARCADGASSDAGVYVAEIQGQISLHACLLSQDEWNAVTRLFTVVSQDQGAGWWIC
jgi:hypothetical protein